MYDKTPDNNDIDGQRLAELVASLQEHPSAEDETMSLDATLGAFVLAEELRSDEDEALPQAIDTLPLLAITETQRTHGHIPEVEHLELMGPLGKGGIGEVFLAKQSSLSRQVAVKRLRTESQEKGEEKRLLMLREAQITGFLEHPNIIPIHLLGRDESGQPAFVMKRVEGVSWRTLIHDKQHKAWTEMKLDAVDPLERHIEILIDVCKALEFAHDKGFLHCDIKPDNVMIGRFGEVYLLDWGIAMPLRDHAIPDAAEDIEVARHLIGTPAYMAPEMVFGPKHFRRSTDVYLLGATLHEVLTKRVRHEGDELKAVLQSALASTPYEYPDQVPQELADICNQATNPKPAQRWQDPSEFRAALQHFLRHRSANALTQEAYQRLDALKEALASRDDNASEAAEQESEADRQRLFTECRFGFLQSLREWPNNHSASRGLRQCLETMLAHYIQSEQLTAANALVTQLDEIPPKWQAKLQALRDKHKRQRALYEAHLQDSNQGISIKQRIFLLGFISLLSFVLPGYLFPQLLKDAMSPVAIFLLTASLWIIFATGCLAFRDKLLTNQFNRRFVWYMFMAITITMLNRALGWYHDIDAIHTLVLDLILMGCLSIYAIQLSPTYIAFAVAQFAMVGWALVQPSQIELIYNALIVCMVGIYLVWMRKGAQQVGDATQASP